MLSIVTGTLNRKHMLDKLIKNTVDSCDKLELILVDGGSNDGTIEFIKHINHKRVKLIEIGSRSKYSHFMNLGIKNSSYNYICQWNDDALMINNWDEVISNIEKEYDFYLFNWKYGSETDMINSSWLAGKDQTSGWCLADNSSSGGEVVMNYGIYSKNIFQKIGMYNSEYQYYYADGDMSYRAHKFNFKHKALYHIKVCSLYTNKIAIHFSNDEQVYRKNLNLYNSRILPETIEILQ